MPRVKQASTRKRKNKAVAAVQVLGAAGLGFSLAGNASAATTPTTDIPQSGNKNLPNQHFVLGEEEMADVSLATFYLFDKENNIGGGVQLARGCGGCGHGCGGCRAGGCGGCRVGGCGHGCGGCRIGGCGGCGFGGCGIIACIGCAGCAGCAGCCLSWGACRLC